MHEARLLHCPAVRSVHGKVHGMSITKNRKAQYDYSIEERFEAGLVLEGWEVKSVRAGRAQLNEAYVIIRDAELFLLNAHFGLLMTTSTHELADPTRTRKLLMHAEEIRKLIGKVERAGYALVPLDLHFSKGRVKLALGLAKGKKQYEKRDAEQDKDWKREQSRLLKQRSR